MTWVRKRADTFAQWHLVAGEATGQARVAVRLLACGQTVGLEGDPELEVMVDDSAIGGRCPACQGVALRGVRR